MIFRITLAVFIFKGHLSVVNIDGGPSDEEGESTLDIQMAAGLAPAASIVVYQTDGNASDDPWTQVNDELQKIIDTNTNNANAGSVVSISLGIDEGDISSDDVRALDSSLQQLTKGGAYDGLRRQRRLRRLCRRDLRRSFGELSRQ